MGKNSNKNKSEQLGMPFGTATSKLRKHIMFHLAKKAGCDKCFRCGEKIESVDEFTIEHKVPWMNNSTDLFWDINNIAFSHKKCNTCRPNRKYNGNENEAWCYRCKKFLPKSEFNNNITRWNGVDSECKSCKSTRVIESKWYNKKHIDRKE